MFLSSDRTQQRNMRDSRGSPTWGSSPLISPKREGRCNIDASAMFVVGQFLVSAHVHTRRHPTLNRPLGHIMSPCEGEKIPNLFSSHLIWEKTAGPGIPTFWWPLSHCLKRRQVGVISTPVLSVIAGTGQLFSLAHMYIHEHRTYKKRTYVRFWLKQK